MIFQFKISLKGVQPPVWRRLQIDSELTFQELHEIIQVAFSYDQTDSHVFMMDRHGGDIMVQLITPTGENIELSSFTQLNESEELLRDWFIMDKDRAIYTCSFDDNLKHEILFEKAVERDFDKTYPHCVKAQRLSPGELGYGFDEASTYSSLHTENLNNDFYKLAVSKGWDKVVEPDENRFDWAQLLEEAKEFNALQPWRSLDDSQVFVVEDPIANQHLYCSILGAAGIEFGMAVYIGNQGFDALNSIVSEDTMDDILLKQRSVLLSFVDRDELDSSEYDFLKKHGVTFRGSKQWVQLTSFVPGKYPWFMDDEEGRVLQLAIRQAKEILLDIEKGQAIRHYRGGNHFSGRIVSKNSDVLSWEFAQIESPGHGGINARNAIGSLEIDEVTVKRLTKLPFTTQSIIFDAFMLETPIQEASFERPYFPLLTVALSDQDGSIIWQDMIQASSASEIQHAFVTFIEFIGFLPESVTVTKATADLLEPLSEHLGISMSVAVNIPEVEELREYMSMVSRLP